ncbi:MAG: DNA polymerase III subunit alpha [Polyangia bacterium]|jgi:DNA polymerase-3 subunit alpha|nr:DNA polymerase III subunit alpha [Polyangia bacterium]
MSSFAHLHLHSQYSLLDGAIHMDRLPEAVLARGMQSVAVTDHGNMFGAVHFFKVAKRHGVKPIFGCEVYVAESDRTDRSKRSAFHLVLLARNAIGFRNLRYLVSMGYLEGFYYVPRIDRKILADHAEGLIGLSACLGGQVARSILDHGAKAAEDVAREYQRIFEPGMFFLEVQPNGMADQLRVNEELRRMGPALGIPLVATNDCHYMDREDALVQEVLMAVQQGRTLQDDKRIKHESEEYYLKTAAEMEAHFADLPESLENAARIAELCSVELELGKTYLPDFSPPGGLSQEEYVGELARKGLEERLGEARARGEVLDRGVYEARLESELGTIALMGFAGYFLIVQDFIGAAKRIGVPVGPGRGSGAGSLVAYALRITDLDPLPYGLLFERFLNPERVSMPDFDVDFCMNRRDEVLRYVKERYGKDNVGQIVTFSTFKARGLVRDVARVLGWEYSEGDAVAKLVPEGPKVTLSSALDEEPKLKELYEQDTKVRRLYDIARGMEGLHRHAGMHAAGVVISGKPLWEYVPCLRAQEGQVIEVVSQYAKEEVEQAGLVKFDFLGLKTLTIIDESVKRINALRRAAGEPPIELDKIPLDDEGVYEMISRGDTAGVFQLESDGFTKLLRKLKPDRFEDIVAAVALYRPGPLQGGMVDQFIDCKHGRQKVVYPHAVLEPILKETYGVMVYQEQVMQAAQIMGGFTLGAADLLRRAMGKKKVKELEAQREKFVSGAESRGIPREIAEDVFELMFKFAEYGFNKSHSAAYGLITYQTAYLKHHYSVEFMAGLLSCEKENSDNIVKYMAVAREMGIAVLPPDVNESDLDFSVVRDGRGRKVIRFGLGAVKKVGEGAVEATLAERLQGGAYRSIFDFCERVDLRRVNKGVVEALVKASAFDSTVAGHPDIHRNRLLAALPAAVERGQRVQKERRSGQTNLLDLFGGVNQQQPGHEGYEGECYPVVEAWTPRQLLEHEKESLGFYISGHPLDRYHEDLKKFTTHTTRDLANTRERGEITLGGVVLEYRERPLRSGEGHLALFRLEDLHGKVEVMVGSKLLSEVRELLQAGEPVLVSGWLRFEGEDEGRTPGLRMKSVMSLAERRVAQTREVHLKLLVSQVDRERLIGLRQLIEGARGECQVYVHMVIPDHSETVIVLPTGLRVAPTDELLLRTERLFGDRVAVLR